MRLFETESPPPPDWLACEHQGKLDHINELFKCVVLSSSLGDRTLTSPPLKSCEGPGIDSCNPVPRLMMPEQISPHSRMVAESCPMSAAEVLKAIAQLAFHIAQPLRYFQTGVSQQAHTTQRAPRFSHVISFVTFESAVF